MIKRLLKKYLHTTEAYVFAHFWYTVFISLAYDTKQSLRFSNILTLTPHGRVSRFIKKKFIVLIILGHTNMSRKMISERTKLATMQVPVDLEFLHFILLR